MKKKIFAALLALLTGFGTAQAQMILVEGGKAKARIVCEVAEGSDAEAARMLNLFIERISGTELPVVADTEKSKGNIFIGGSTDEAGEEGFKIECSGGNLSILSGGGKGSLYGAVTVLERYLGVSYYAKGTYKLTESKDVVLPAFSDVETPAFRYRQTQGYGLEDPLYRAWFRLEEPDDMFVEGMWVHTFNRILPASKYGKEHPEWYSFINGERRPGDHSQWCLSNPEVLEAAVAVLDSIFRANPGMKMISVSQNDGNNTYCTCPECSAVDEYEGAHSGSYIRFMNKLAERFPDKEFSTLAYLFTMKAPMHVKPLPNVNIMLCDIDCKREVPLTENASGREFMEALEGWSAISNNIFVWDYGINFDNFVSPFPNFHVLGKNIDIFREHNVNMLFEQIGGDKGTDFCEMRSYVVAKLMWNPERDVDGLMQEFMTGYYGAAAPYLYQYQKIMEGALLSSGLPLWIYDSPVSHKDGMLKPYLRRVYNELFDSAESAVADDSLSLDHVRLSRLPLQFADLEIARTEAERDRDWMIPAVNLFGERCAEFGVETYTEKHNRPQDYCKLYLERYLPSEAQNKALGARVLWISAPDEKYKALGETALTDGLYGGSSYVEGWVGWEGRDGEFIIDLGQDTEISSIEADFLQQLGGWVFLPKGVRFSVAGDIPSENCSTGTDLNELLRWQDYGTYIPFAESRDLAPQFHTARADASAAARYIRVSAETLGLCPSWHYGVGYPAWFFLDEVYVR